MTTTTENPAFDDTTEASSAQSHTALLEINRPELQIGGSPSP